MRGWRGFWRGGEVICKSGLVVTLLIAYNQYPFVQSMQSSFLFNDFLISLGGLVVTITLLLQVVKRHNKAYLLYIKSTKTHLRRHYSI